MSDQPIHSIDLDVEMTELMRAAGLPDAYRYAWQQTGMLVTEMNYDQWSDEDLAEWADAIERYERLQTSSSD